MTIHIIQTEPKITIDLNKEELHHLRKVVGSREYSSIINAHIFEHLKAADESIRGRD